MIALSGTHRSTTGTKTRSSANAIGVSTPPSSPGQTRHRSPRQRPDVVAVQPDARRPEPLPALAVPRDHASALPRADDAVAGEDRRRLEVVVAHVVRRHLVVPEQPAAARVEHDERVGVERATGERAAVRQLAATRPTARDSPCRGTGARRRRPRPGTRCRRRPPPSACAHGSLIVSNFQRTVARLRVERIGGAAAARRVADGADQDEALPEDRRDVDELLRRAREMPPPQLASRLRVEGERVGVGLAVDAAVAEREPVRPVVAEPVAPLPAQRAARAVEREDVAAQILDVHGVAGDDRRRREDARDSCAARGTGSASARADSRRCRSRSSSRRLRACRRDPRSAAASPRRSRWPPHPAARHATPPLPP